MQALEAGSRPRASPLGLAGSNRRRAAGEDSSASSASVARRRCQRRHAAVSGSRAAAASTVTAACSTSSGGSSSSSGSGGGWGGVSSITCCPHASPAWPDSHAWQRRWQRQQRQQQSRRRVSSLVCRAAAGPNGGGNGSGSGRQQRPASWDQLPDPWDPAARSAASTATAGTQPPPPPPPPGQPPAGPDGRPDFGATDWGWDSGEQGWDPAEGLSPPERAALEADYAAFLARQRGAQAPARDKWITPLLDWQSIAGAFDPDQSRTEGAMADEALTNKSESREALAFLARLVVIPVVTGALVGRALAEPILSFTLANNPDAFAMTSRQKVEGAERVHQEEARVRMLMAIGQAPPLDEVGMARHLREFARELQEEERHHNEAGLVTLVGDMLSLMVGATIFARDADGRAALSSTIARLFEGLSDIAKAVLIILIADTSLGYHSEEGWTALIDIVLGHYGIEAAEKAVVLFVGIIPIAIDVAFKYWIFKGLNRISPGAVVTIKALDRH